MYQYFSFSFLMNNVPVIFSYGISLDCISSGFVWLMEKSQKRKMWFSNNISELTASTHYQMAPAVYA